MPVSIVRNSAMTMFLSITSWKLCRISDENDCRHNKLTCRVIEDGVRLGLVEAKNKMK